MKRLFATVGLTYLSVLSAVFYFANGLFTNVLIIISTLSLLLGIFFKIIKRLKRLKKELINLLITVGASALFACVSIILYTNIIYQPVINNYSDKEINVEGYICDEVQVCQNSSIYLIKAEKINGKSENVKIELSSIESLGADAFDKIKARIYVNKAESYSNISRGVFLSAFYDDETDSFSCTNEKKFSLYGVAVNVRKAMKASLDSILSESSSSLCKAVLLGDKNAVSYDVRNDFTKTGMSFLIVVSGMHLAIIAGFALFLLKRIINNRYLICAIITAIVFAFMAVTGFSSSVIRSGIMVIIIYCSKLVFRRADSLNSLGAAAVFLTFFNPYSVGNIGMLLSFAATLGIILWADKIKNYILRKLNFKRKHRILKFFINIFAVSVSASLWTIPIATFAFHRVSPFAVITSLFAEPLVGLLLICTLFASLLNICPIISFLAYPFSLVCEFLSKSVLSLISLFASIPYCSVNSDKPYFYIWLVFTALLVVIGYLIWAKGFYVKCSAVSSAVLLIIVWAIYSIVGYNTTILKIYNVGSGVTATVECGNNISFISCGGEFSNAYNIINEISGDFFSVDNIIIPNTKLKYSKYLPQLSSEFDLSNILIYDNKNKYKNKIDKFLETDKENSRYYFAKNSHFTIDLNSNTTLDVLNIDSVTYEYININGNTILFVPSLADISKLPEKYRICDYLLTDSNIKNGSLLSCKNLIFSGNESLLKTKYSSVAELTDNIFTTSDGTLELVFNGG